MEIPLLPPDDPVRVSNNLPNTLQPLQLNVSQANTVLAAAEALQVS